MRQIKVMFYVDGYKQTTGYSRVVRNLAKRLAKDDKYMVICQDLVDFSPSSIEDGKVLRLPSMGLRQKPEQTPFLAGVLNHINLLKPDVFIPVTDAFLMTADGLDKLDFGSVKLMPYIPIDSKIVPDTSAGILQKADKILVQSEFGREELSKQEFDSIVFRHGVETDKFKENKERRQAVRKELCIDDDTTVFLFIGRNSQRKRLEWLIRAYADYRVNHPETKTLLVLHGSNYDSGSNNIRKRINFESARIGINLDEYIEIPYEDHNLGAGVTEDKLIDLYHACDWTISGSSGEGTGLLSLEGFANGKPTIYPKNSNWKETVGKNNERGLAVDNCATLFTGLMTEQQLFDNDEMVKTIYEAVTIPEDKYLEKVENAKQWVSINANWDKLTNELKVHIGDVLNE